MPKKINYGGLFIVIASLLLSFLNSPLNEIFFDDREIFKYAGMLICKGGVPYRDFFDHKPPLIYFFYALHCQNAWLFWLLDSLLVLTGSLLFYSLCRKSKLSHPWVLPVLFNLLIRYSLVSFGNGMTREYTTVFLLIFFCIMQGASKSRYLVMGILTGLTFWMQQDALITLLPFFIYAFFGSPKDGQERKINQWIAFISGGLISTLPLFIYFTVKHALRDVWNDAFLFNLHPPGIQYSFAEKIKAIKHALHVGEFEMAFYTALILGIACLAMKHRNKALCWTALAGFILSVPGEFLSGRLAGNISFIYYLLPLAATIPILVYVSFTESEASVLRDKTSRLIYSLILSTTLILGTFRFAAAFLTSKKNPEGFSNLPAWEYLHRQPLSDFQLFVFDDSNLIFLYNHFKILAPSPWVYQYFYGWDAQWDADGNILHSIMQDLLLHKTQFVLDCSVSRNDMKNKRLFEDWQEFLSSHYTPILRDSSNRVLWRSK